MCWSAACTGSFGTKRFAGSILPGLRVAGCAVTVFAKATIHNLASSSMTGREVASRRQHGGNVDQAAAATTAASLIRRSRMVAGAASIAIRPALPAADHAAATLGRPAQTRL
jgi:hypothetical protein